MPDQSSPPPPPPPGSASGWYPDPDGEEGRLRWWDGHKWTDGRKWAPRDMPDRLGAAAAGESPPGQRDYLDAIMRHSSIVTYVVLGTLAIVLLLGVIFQGREEAQQTAQRPTVTSSPLERAVETCGEYGSDGITVDEAGLFIDGEGEEDDGASVSQIACLLVALGAPESVTARMDATSALMGVQGASWGEFEASWSFHPSNGLDISIVER